MPERELLSVQVHFRCDWPITHSTSLSGAKAFIVTLYSLVQVDFIPEIEIFCGIIYISILTMTFLSYTSISGVTSSWTTRPCVCNCSATPFYGNECAPRDLVTRMRDNFPAKVVVVWEGGKGRKISFACVRSEAVTRWGPFILLLKPLVVELQLQGEPWMSRWKVLLRYTGLSKRKGAKLGESFCPAAASHSRPCQASA